MTEGHLGGEEGGEGARERRVMGEERGRGGERGRRGREMMYTVSNPIKVTVPSVR